MAFRSYKTFSTLIKVPSLNNACTSSHFKLDNQVSELKPSSIAI